MQIELDLKTEEELKEEEAHKAALSALEEFTYKLRTDPDYRNAWEKRITDEMTALLKEQNEKEIKRQRAETIWWAKNKDRTFDI